MTKAWEKRVLREEQVRWGRIGSIAFDDPTRYADRPGSTKVLNLIIQDVLKSLRIGFADKVLDVGCGNGLIAKEIRRHSSEVVGCDYSTTILSRRSRDAVHYVSCEASQLPFRDDVFDKCLSYSVFHYFPNLEHAELVIRELKRVGKPKVRIFVGDLPNLVSLILVTFLRRRGSLILSVWAYHFVKNIPKVISEEVFNHGGVHQGIIKAFKRCLFASIGQGTFYSPNEILDAVKSNGLKGRTLKQREGLPFSSYRYDLLITSH